MAKLTEFRREIPTDAVWFAEHRDPDTGRWELLSGIAWATRDEARDEVKDARKLCETKYCVTRWVRAKVREVEETEEMSS